MSKQVSSHLQRVYFKWLLIVAAVVFVIQIGIMIVRTIWIGTIFGDESSHVFSSMHETSSIVLMIFGIIAVFPYLNRLAFHGVTRKNYLKGTMEAAIKTTLLSLIIALVFLGLEFAAIKLFELPFDQALNLGNFGDNLLIASIGYFLSLLVIFFIGWAIGLSFYKYRGVGGTISIIASLFIFGLLDYFWENEYVEITINGVSIFTFWQSHILVSFIGTLLIGAILLLVIRNLSRDVTIRL